jgi:hypothetical protein
VLRVSAAVELRLQGKSIIEATMLAGEQRLRPIVMTSLAFAFGVLPLALALGAGANYYGANKSSTVSGMVFLKQGFYRWKPRPATALRLGRFEFLDGSEVTPTDPTLAALKAQRIQQRLIGHFLWTHVGRSFDGAQIVNKTGKWTQNAMAMVPTRGVFQTDGWGWNRTALSYLSATRPTGKDKSAGELRLFGIYYHDFRHVLKTDSRALAARHGRHRMHLIRRRPLTRGGQAGVPVHGLEEFDQS